MPGPTSYDIKSEFETNKTSKYYLKNGKGFSFYESHDKYRKVYNEYNPKNFG